MLKTLWFIFYTEIILLFRRSQDWIYPLAFFTMIVCFFPLALSPETKLLQQLIPGILWMAALLASLLSQQTIFFADHEEQHLTQLLLSPIPFPSILISKLLAQWLVTQLPLILLTPLIAIAFHLSMSISLILSLSLLIGTPILTCVGSLGAALTLGLQQQGVLLGVLLLPLLTPVLIFGVNIVQQFAAGFNVCGALLFLSGLTILTFTLSPLAIAATLRIAYDD